MDTPTLPTNLPVRCEACQSDNPESKGIGNIQVQSEDRFEVKANGSVVQADIYSIKCSNHPENSASPCTRIAIHERKFLGFVFFKTALAHGDEANGFTLVDRSGDDIPRVYEM